MPSEFYQFKSWTGWNDVETNPLEITIRANVNITAVFDKIDDDEDGVLDINDNCKNTTEGSLVDVFGCSASENEDDDNDGVINGMDFCSNTPPNTKVDIKGCTIIEDIEGNEYGTIIIGTQIWMSESLRTTMYNNRNVINHIIGDEEWKNTTEDAYCNYDNNTNTYEDYGRLYNWKAATKNICPENWHLPSKEEWNILVEYLGGEDVAGEKLKETGNNHWFTPNEDFSTNESGFSARGSGSRFANGQNFQLDGLKRGSSFWTSNEDVNDNDKALIYLLSFSNKSVTQRTRDKKDGNAIRCIKN